MAVDDAAGTSPSSGVRGKLFGGRPPSSQVKGGTSPLIELPPPSGIRGGSAGWWSSPPSSDLRGRLSAG